MQGYPPPGGYGGPPQGPPQGPPGYGAPPGGGYGAPPGGGFSPPGGGYGPPQGNFAAPPGGGSTSSASSKVAPPAIGLIVTGILAILYQLVMLVLNLLGTGLGAFSAASGGSGGMSTLFSGVIGLVFNVVWILLSGLVIFGAVKMKNLQSWGLSMAAAVVAALPCTNWPCCLLGLPLGIWAIVMLMDQQVKASFTS